MRKVRQEDRDLLVCLVHQARRAQPGPVVYKAVADHQDLEVQQVIVGHQAIVGRRVHRDHKDPAGHREPLAQEEEEVRSDHEFLLKELAEKLTRPEDAFAE